MHLGELRSAGDNPGRADDQFGGADDKSGSVDDMPWSADDKSGNANNTPWSTWEHLALLKRRLGK